MAVLETRPGAYRLTPIAGPVNRTCQATTIAVAASTTKSGCNQETKMDAIRKGRRITAVMMRDILDSIQTEKRLLWKSVANTPNPKKLAASAVHR